jgi:hypothetical protein
MQGNEVLSRRVSWGRCESRGVWAERERSSWKTLEVKGKQVRGDLESRGPSTLWWHPSWIASVSRIPKQPSSWWLETMGKRAYRWVCWRLLVDGWEEVMPGDLDWIMGLAYALQCEECRYLDQECKYLDQKRLLRRGTLPYAKKRVVIEAYLN